MNPGTIQPGRDVAMAVSCNTGGPMTRTRSEPVSSHLLGRQDGAIRCPRILRLGLEFDAGADPVSTVMAILEFEGFDAAEELRAVFTVPDAPMIAAPQRNPGRRLPVVSAPPQLILEQALLLGLCTPNRFDPARPVLWTQASLTRALDLFEPMGFYA